jgi:hypothetical protein
VGARNIDRIPIADLRSGHETVAEMLAAEWEVISKCDTCHLAMAVDLDLVIWRTGPKTSLWNRSAPCRRLGCKGRVSFQARVPGGGGHQALCAPDPVRRR